MQLDIENFYRDIGQTAVDFLPDLDDKFLVYGEVEEGVISASLIYVAQDGAVRFRLAPEKLQDQIYAFWDAWQSNPDNREWRIMSYVFENNKAKIDLLYPDQIVESDSRIQRRSAAIMRYFGNVAVDYSRP